MLIWHIPIPKHGSNGVAVLNFSLKKRQTKIAIFFSKMVRMNAVKVILKAMPVEQFLGTFLMRPYVYLVSW